MRRLPLILVLVHSAIVLLVAGGVYASLLSGSREAVQLWALPAFIDLPVAWLIAGSEAILKTRLDEAREMVRWVWLPAGAYLVLGGAWWWSLGVVIVMLKRRLPNNMKGGQGRSIVIGELGITIEDTVHGERSSICWDDVDEIVTYKQDCGTIDDIRLVIRTSSNCIEVSEEDRGFMECVGAMQRKFPTIPSDWYLVVMHPAFAKNERVLWKRE